MEAASLEAILREKFAALKPVLNERTRRRWAATAANALGRGGQSLVAKVTGMARTTIYLHLQELKQEVQAVEPVSGVSRGSWIRRPGGGRKPLLYHQPTLLRDLLYNGWWNPPVAATPSRPCAGLVKACANWWLNCKPKGTL